MADKAASNKLQKMRSLIDAAQDLFIEQGLANTSVDEITKKAKVAKGTFYLYFTDKYDLMNRIVMKISTRVLLAACDAAEAAGEADLAERICRVADYVINDFAENKRLLKMVERNFSWSLARAEASAAGAPFARLLDLCCAAPEMAGRSRDDVFKLVFVICELLSATAYTAILYQQPDDIEHMKPLLFKAIRLLIENPPLLSAAGEM